MRIKESHTSTPLESCGKMEQRREISSNFLLKKFENSMENLTRFIHLLSISGYFHNVVRKI